MVWIYLSLLYLVSQTNGLQLDAPQQTIVGQPITVTWTRDKSTDPTSFKLVSAKSFNDPGWESHQVVDSNGLQTGTASVTLNEEGSVYIGAIQVSDSKDFHVLAYTLVQVGEPHSTETTSSSDTTTSLTPAAGTSSTTSSTSSSTKNTLSNTLSTTIHPTLGISSLTTSNLSQTVSDKVPAFQTSNPLSQSSAGSVQSFNTTGGDPNTTDGKESQADSNTSSPTIIIGVVVGVVGFLIALALLFVFTRRCKRRHRRTSFCADRMVRDPSSPPWMQNMMARHEQVRETESAIPQDKVMIETSISTPADFSVSPEPTSILYAPKRVSRKAVPEYEK